MVAALMIPVAVHPSLLIALIAALGEQFFALPVMTAGTCVPVGSSTSDVASDVNHTDNKMFL